MCGLLALGLPAPGQGYCSHGDQRLKKQKKQCLRSGLRIRLLIGSGFSRVSGSGSGSYSESGSGRAKMTHKSRKKLRNFMYQINADPQPCLGYRCAWIHPQSFRIQGSEPRRPVCKSQVKKMLYLCVLIQMRMDPSAIV